MLLLPEVLFCKFYISLWNKIEELSGLEQKFDDVSFRCRYTMPGSFPHERRGCFTSSLRKGIGSNKRIREEKISKKVLEFGLLTGN